METLLNPMKGTPQGPVISPILANVYLHYVLDLWFEKVVKKHCEGEAYLVRYADDFVVIFRYKKDAEKYYRTLWKRLGKFNLKLVENKTRIISFRIWYKWLNRRSQRRSFNWKEFNDKIRYYEIPRPKLMEQWWTNQAIQNA